MITKMASMKRLALASLFFVLTVQFVFAQSPLHTRLLYENSLSAEGEDDFAAATNFSGAFVGNGWQAKRDSKLTLQLKNRLPAVGSIEFSITNFNPVLQATNGKQTLFAFSSRPHTHLSLFYEDSLSSFTFLRTGTNYVNGDRCGLEFDTAYEGAKSRDKDREVLMDNKWDSGTTYHFKFSWDHDYIWLFFNGQEVKKQLMKGPIERIQHISIGGDDIYNTMAGPIYSDVKIYTAETGVRFEDKSFSKNVFGMADPKGGRGLAVADVNGDGLDDIYVANYQDGDNLRDILYVQQPDFSFVDETLSRGIENDGSFSTLFFDADNDGDADLFRCRVGAANQLFINDGSGHFSNEGNARGIGAGADRTSAAAAFDVDNDGDIDLLAVNQNAAHELYINSGAGVFTRQERGFAPGGATGEDMPSVATCDVDNDGHVDVYISWPNAANELYRNDGSGNFTERAAFAGIDFPQRSQGVVFADYDNDGDSDLFLATKVNAYNSDSLFVTIYANDGGGNFSAITPSVQPAMNGYAVQLFDADNDGRLDIYCLQNNQFDRYYEGRTWNFFRTSMGRLYLGDGAGGFAYAGDGGADIVGADARASIVNDFDHDGDMDIYVATANFENVFLNNSSESANNWIDLIIMGPSGDLGGMGSKIWLYEPGFLGQAAHVLAFRQTTANSGYAASGNVVQHFGLGDLTACDVRVQRLDGSVQTRLNLAAQARYVLSPDVLHVERVAGDNQSGFINEPLPEPLVVAVKNQAGRPIKDVAVLFRVTAGAGVIQGDSLVYTDESGLAQAFVAAGGQAGAVTVLAVVDAAVNSPIEFTATIDVPTYLLQKAAGDQQDGVVGQSLANEIVVQVHDQRGKTFSGVPVTFKITSGAGALAGVSERIVLSDADGMAATPWTLGVAAGGQTMLAATSDDTLHFSALARAANGAVLHKRSGDGQHAEPGEPFPDPFTVFVSDAYGNPVQNFPVQFNVLAGGGRLSGDSSQTVLTDEAGLAGVLWTTGPYLGPDNILQAAAERAGSPLIDSPVQWQYAGVAVDANVSTLTATSPIPADGVSQTHIVVALKNSAGEPLGAGLTVRFSATGDDNIWAAPDSLTNADGVVTARLACRIPQSKIITAAVMGLNLPLANGADVEFQPLPQIPAQLSVVSGDAQTGVVGKPLHKPLVVQLVDKNGEGVPDYPVTFVLRENGGRSDSLKLPLALTNENGRASLDYVLGARAGRSLITAAVDSVDGSPVTFTLLASPDAPSALTMVSGDSQRVDSDASLPAPLVVRLTDQYDNIISAAPVLFEAVNGGRVLTPQPSATDSAGLARCRVATADSGAAFYFTASHDSLDKVRFTAFARQVFVNHPPVIESILPVDSLLTVDYNHRLLFNIIASDPDDDPLFYKWTLDHAHVSDSSSFSFTAFPTLQSPVHITALVYDLKDTTRQSWTVMFTPTAVELSTFEANFSPGVGVVLSWRTPAGFGAVRFDVLKSDKEDGRYETIQTISAIHARSKGYEFVDNNVSRDGVSYYKLKATFADGHVAEWGPVSATAFIPTEISLHANYPNPFNPATTIRFELPQDMNIELQVFNAKGQMVKMLQRGEMNAGYHTVQWRADSDAGLPVPSGIYYCRLTAEGRVMIRKMLLLK